MSKSTRKFSFPREWEFNRAHENAEAILMGDKIPNPEVPCPFSLQDLIDELLNNFPEETRQGLLGSLYARMRNLWYDYYDAQEKAKAGGEKAAPAPPNKLPYKDN